jgi:CheY-like chemotaxis protein
VEADMSNRNLPRALIVDDSTDSADMLAMLLRLWGYHTKVCYGGASALEAAPIFRPQVVLLDIGMPGMDGFQVASGLREMPGLEETVIIGISGHTGENCRFRARETGMSHYLIKPEDPVHLQDLLAQALPFVPGRVKQQIAIVSHENSLQLQVL